MRTVVWLGVMAATALPVSVPAAAPARCLVGGTVMSRLLCGHPELAARDAAMNTLYRLALPVGGAGLRTAQRRWLARAMACGDAGCLESLYDARLGDLLQHEADRPIIRRFHFEKAGVNGDLLVLHLGGWLAYDAVETAVGPGGRASGDVGAARLSGTARMASGVARDWKAVGCRVTLRAERNGDWSMTTRRCFEVSPADLNVVFQPVANVRGGRLGR